MPRLALLLLQAEPGELDTVVKHDNRCIQTAYSVLWMETGGWTNKYNMLNTIYCTIWYHKILTKESWRFTCHYIDKDSQVKYVMQHFMNSEINECFDFQKYAWIKLYIIRLFFNVMKYMYYKLIKWKNKYITFKYN